MDRMQPYNETFWSVNTNVTCLSLDFLPFVARGKELYTFSNVNAYKGRNGPLNLTGMGLCEPFKSRLLGLLGLISCGSL